MKGNNTMSNEVEVYSEETAVVSKPTVESLKSGADFLSTMPTSTVTQKIDLLNAIDSPVSLSDHEGAQIELAGVIAMPVQFRSAQHNDELVDGIGIYLVDTQGQSFLTVSGGMYAAVKRLLGVLGTESKSWPKGLTVTPEKVKLDKGRSTWRMKIDVPEGGKK